MDISSGASLLALKELLTVQGEADEEDQIYRGSVLNPGDIGGDGKKKEVAKPFTKVEAKINNRQQL